MEAQQNKTYGEGFRHGVTRVLEELDKLSFLKKDMREALTTHAAKLCLAEAMMERQADELKERAIKEWQQQAPEIKATAERLKAELLKSGEEVLTQTAREATSVLKRLFPETPSKNNDQPGA
jgi:F0F1-type ATP synthase membrane subunit b/b'